MVFFAAMSRSVKFPISIALAVVVAAALSSVGSAKGRAKLVLVDTHPVVVAGRGFAPAERVTLRTTLNGRRITKHVTATRTGRFTVRLATEDAECTPLAISAVGREGSRASLRKIVIPPPCGIPIAP
jgi:hypothetical protein